MKLSGEAIRTLADFSDGAECAIAVPHKGRWGDEIVSRVKVTRLEDREVVYIYETGQIEKVTANG